MKKSDMYRMAQLSVLNNELIMGYDKLKILRELMHQEDVAKYVESKEEE